MQTLASVPPHLPTPPPSIMELSWSPLATLPCRVASPLLLEQHQGSSSLWAPRSQLHNGMYYCAVCLKVFPSAGTALALGYLMCCQQAIQPVPMADFKGYPRPPVATCSDLTDLRSQVLRPSPRGRG